MPTLFLSLLSTNVIGRIHKRLFLTSLIFIQRADTSTTAPLVSWQKKDFISFITGLMTELGIHWAELLEARFTQVGCYDFLIYAAQLAYIRFVLNARFSNDM